ncbi:class I SAM-dependent methyltransferase [Micromonospora phytophila]|uniref:class I SAM-dependent DNA methyltransferase n=1 Tax=Micromonospora phytophila TaxID=709888 RepID=UPI002030BBA6|nr:class I SAM-dependent methyltransferase [Micromonospora phytophila]MCM0677024.1 class I SAM-dependent methyltransferase [Micromonospora phytophila]
MIKPDFLRETRASYDAVATDYAEYVRDALNTNTWDRAFLAAFAETVRATGGGPVADVGCGPGRVTGHLHGLGLDVFGIDLSPAMVAQARRSHPGLRFDEGSMTGLNLPEGTLGGIVAWYSIIHVPDELLPAAFAGFHRALAPGGHLALAFQVGDEPLHLTEALGHPVDLTFHRRQPDRVAALLAAAGLEVRARLLREPERYAGVLEKTPQAYLLARRPATAG